MTGVIKLLTTVFLLLLACIPGEIATAQEPGLVASSRVLAIVPVKAGNVNQSIYRQFDRIVPELKRISKDRIVKLECRYSGNPGKEKDVAQAYHLAGQLEKYLRVHHKLDLDFWIAIDVASKLQKTAPVLTIAVFSDDIKHLDSVVIDPKKN